MDQTTMIQQLETNLEMIEHFYAGVSTDQARWKPEPAKWSMLEILNHLYDEERDDFRKRLTLILDNPETEWPPVDPEGWASRKDYNSRDLSDSLGNFSRERKESIEWLRGLQNPNWDIEKTHPLAGSLKAGDLLAAWVVHDFLHMRQLANIMVAYTSATAEPYSTKYAAP
jgi:hypothetical protein